MKRQYQSGAAKRKAKKQRREIEAKGRQTLEDCGWRILHPSSLGESSVSQPVASSNVSAAEQGDDELSEAVQLEIGTDLVDERTHDIESYSSASSEGSSGGW